MLDYGNDRRSISTVCASTVASETSSYDARSHELVAVPSSPNPGRKAERALQHLAPMSAIKQRDIALRT
jgi:hypothetical protein